MRMLLSFFVLMVMSFSSIAKWYESQGQASTKELDSETARQKAIENALQQSLLVAGASVSSVKQVVNGLLMQDEISIRANGIVNSLELVSENYQDDIVTVKIRADIFPQEHQCISADYRKSLLITQSKILHRQQANIGEIYQINSAISHQLANQLKSSSRFIDVEIATQGKTQFSRLNNSFNAEKIQNLVMALAQKTNNQYVLFSEINDISFDNKANNHWQFWQSDIFNRHFNFSVYIYNGINGEKVLEKNYQSQAPWNFNKREIVDVNSLTFWQSAYGKSINQTLSKLMNDIDENMMCQNSRGQIVKIAGNTITFNLGKRQGVKIGDEFSVVHLSIINADDNRNYSGYNISPYKVTVSQVSNESAKAISTNGEVLGSVQIKDLVIKH